MENPFEYPDDRSEFFGEANEEEASFYFSLMDFEKLIEHYGTEFVLNRLGEETFNKLAVWFLEDDDEELIDWRNTDEA